MRLKLAAKLVIISFICSLFTGLLYLTMNIGNLTNVYLGFFIEQYFNIAQDLRPVIVDSLKTGKTFNTLEGIDQICKKIKDSHQEMLYCVIIDNTGKVLYKHNKDFILPEDKLTSAIIRSQKNIVINTKFLNQPIIDFSFPLFDPVNNKKSGSIRIGTFPNIFTELIIKSFVNGIGASVISVIFFVLLIFLIVRATFLKRIKILLYGIHQFGQGDLEYRVRLKSQDEIGDIARSFNTMATNIRELFDERKRALIEFKAINKQLTETDNALWGEMQLARKIQTVLIPEKLKIPGFDISAVMIPAEMIGGDYYDIIQNGDYIWIVIGDVSGHGLASGLIMMMAQTAIHTVLDQNPGITPNELLSTINTTLIKNIKKLGDSKYMTITVIACMDNTQFIYSGLHLPMLIYRAAHKQVDIIDTHGIWIGLLPDISLINKNAVFTLSPGDILMLYTDGLIEARDNNNNLFSLENLTACFLEKCASPVDDIRDFILQKLHSYKTDDDVSILIIKKLNSESGV